MTILRRFIFLVFFVFFVLTVFKTQFHKIRSSAEIPEKYKNEMVKLAKKSITSNDVPVGAILAYKDEIVGRGYNTVIRDNNISGHAEVNALNEALIKYGYQRFMVLDRSDLILYSTFDPCEMCQGTLQHYNIRKIVYLKDKSLFHWWRNDLKSFYYQVVKRKAIGEEIQDSLFNQHPDYPDKK